VFPPIRASRGSKGILVNFFLKQNSIKWLSIGVFFSELKKKAVNNTFKTKVLKKLLKKGKKMFVRIEKGFIFAPRKRLKFRLGFWKISRRK
jgi:hypothetical protein